MPAGIIATKVGMSRVFLESGEAVPVTYLKAEPNTIIRLKTEEKDGYNAVVLGINPRTLKTRKGKEHTKYKIQKEWAVDSLDGYEPGKQVSADTIPVQSVVTVTGVSKGKGFQGVMKRHNFKGGPGSHGSHHHRRPGSIGMCAFPGRVHKGTKLPGQMGKDTITLRERAILISNPKDGVLGVRGPVPGPNGSTVYLTIESIPEAVS